MATAMPAQELSGRDDDMEVSSDIGRPADDNFDIDIDFDVNQNAMHDEDSMMDDTIEPQPDDLMHDSVANDELNDGVMLDGDAPVDEDIPDALDTEFNQQQDMNLETEIGDVTGELDWDVNPGLGEAATDPKTSLSTGLQGTQPNPQPPDSDPLAAEQKDNIDLSAASESTNILPGEPAKDSKLLPNTSNTSTKHEDVDNMLNVNHLVAEIEKNKPIVDSTAENTEQLEHEEGEQDIPHGNTNIEEDPIISIPNGESKAAGNERDAHEAEDLGTEDHETDHRSTFDVNAAGDQKADKTNSLETTTGAEPETSSVGISQAQELPPSLEDEYNADKLCPTLLSFEGNDMFLFASDGVDQLHASVLEDTALAYGPINDLLKACRNVLAPNSTENDYLIFDMPDLQLHITETSSEATHTSLQSVLDVHSRLCWNDSQGEIPALRISTTLRSDCSTKLAELQTLISQGKGYDHLFPAADEEDSSEEQEASAVYAEEEYAEQPPEGEEDEEDEEDEEENDDDGGNAFIENEAPLPEDDLDEPEEEALQLPDDSLEHGDLIDDVENHHNETIASLDREEEHTNEILGTHDDHYNEDQRELDFVAAEEFHNDAGDFGRDDFAAFEEVADEHQNFDHAGDDLGAFGDLVDHDEDDLESYQPISNDNIEGLSDSGKASSRKRSRDSNNDAPEDTSSHQEPKKQRAS